MTKTEKAFAFAFPAGAGMNRFYKFPAHFGLSVPRRRGDEPQKNWQRSFERRRSPQARG